MVGVRNTKQETDRGVACFKVVVLSLVLWQAMSAEQVTLDSVETPCHDSTTSLFDASQDSIGANTP